MPERRQTIVAELLNRLVGFELAYIRSYPGPPDTTPGLPIVTLRQSGSGVLFNLIPGGTFTMGFSKRQLQTLRDATSDWELDPDDDIDKMLAEMTDEGERQVHVPPFLIARCPLRVAEAAYWQGFDPKGDDAPHFEDLDLAGFFDDTIASFLRASGYTLPSETQWEYACRAGSDSLFWWGDAIPDLDAAPYWAEDLDDEDEIARFTNRFGLVNMAAYPELCADLWHSVARGGPTDGSPWITDASENKHVTRGGAAISYPWQVRGEHWTMLSGERNSSDISDIGLAVRPVLLIDLS